MNFLLFLMIFTPLSIFGQNEDIVIFKNYCQYDKRINIWDDKRECIMSLRVRPTDSVSVYLPKKRWYYYEIANLIPDSIAKKTNKISFQKLKNHQIKKDSMIYNKKTTSTKKGELLFFEKYSTIHLTGEVVFP